MTVFVAWTGAEVPAHLPGPWLEVWIGAPGLLFVESDDTLSRVYHELKWSLEDGAALMVAPLTQLPKAKHLAPRTQAWLRDRI